MRTNQQIEQRMARIEAIEKAQVKRARRIAVVLASATVLSLVFLVYGFIQKQQRDETRQELAKVKQELEECRRGR